MDIQGKVALVTGGAAGIGLGCVKELLNEGARGVTIVDLNDGGHGIAEELNITYAGNSKTTKVIFVKADVVDKSALEGAFKATVDEFKNLDIVINNAGICNEINWQRSYDVNLTGVTNGLVLAMEEYLPKYKSTSDAVIVNTASSSALEPWYALPHYSATKFAIIGLTLTFGGDFHYKRSGVRVMAICPGLTDTGITGAINNRVVYNELLLKKMETCKCQDTAVVGKTFTYAIREGKSGSVHSIIEGKRAEVPYPNFTHCNI